MSPENLIYLAICHILPCVAHLILVEFHHWEQMMDWLDQMTALQHYIQAPGDLRLWEILDRYSSLR